jgi:hypothetical protein
MERRAFLRLIGVTLGASAAAQPALALTMAAPTQAPKPTLELTPGVATSDDIAGANIEDAYYGHWRRVTRRHYRRVYRRRY